MKICIINKKYPDINVSILAKNLYEKGHEVTIIAKNIDSYNLIENGIKIMYVLDDNKMLSDTIVELQKHGNIDLIYTYSNNNDINILLKYRKVRIVVELKEYYKNKSLINCADLPISPNNYLKKNDSLVIPTLSDYDNFTFKNKRDKNKNIVYVGTLNEESKVIEFAKNINKIVEETGNIKFQFIGEDTCDNDLNISTIEYITNLVDNKKNLEFIPYLDSTALNEVFNNANLIFNPNTEVLANSNICKLPYLGSNKVKEINPNYDYLFNDDNLFEKTIELYFNKEMQKIISANLVGNDNEQIMNKLEKAFKQAIDNYNENIITELFKEHIDEEIIDFKKIDSGITNFVYLVNTKEKKYVVKTYKKDINEEMINDLIHICEKNGIKVINTIDNNFYKINNNTICIYEYVEGKHVKKLTNEQTEKIIEFIKLDKPSDAKGKCLLDKVDFYYNSLREMDTKKIHRVYIDELLKRYMKLKNYTIFNEKELVHGDLGPTNIIWDENNNYTIIDLDETTLFTKLYDLIVLAINYSKDGNKIDEKMAKKILKSMDGYTKIDIINVWNFYLLKVILEKIYLYEINKIDLRDELELEDNWEDYYEILNSSVIEDILNK